MVSYCDKNGNQMFLLTKKDAPAKRPYRMYEVVAEGSVKKLGDGMSPPELEDKYEINEKICRASCKRASGGVK